MSIHVIHLTGCTPTPLSNYLKALGILRLVAEQKDPDARLWWKNEHAVLGSQLSDNELNTFFADEYHPTPIIAPWNGGSGFYPKDNQTAIKAILDSKTPRLEDYRNAIISTKSILGNADAQPKDREKKELISKLKKELRGKTAEWLSAVAILVDNDKGTTLSYPAILGTGGNDGRLEFTNNFMQRLVELFDIKTVESYASPASRKLLSQSLYNSEPIIGLTGSPIGFFSPAAVGGKANASNTFDCDSRVNPWDYILMLEGAIVFSTGVVRRCNSEQLPYGSAPFAIYGQGVGYCGSVSDENTRGEQWIPLWGAPSTLHDVSQIFEQGRVQLGSKSAKRPAEIARAINRLGAARGINAFERYGYLERNGLAYLAISLGRWNVAAQAHQKVIDHVAEWLDKLERYVNGDNASNALKSSYRSTNDAFMSVIKSASPSRWETLLIAMGELEYAIGASVAAKMPDYPPPPLCNLPSEWVTLLPSLENTPELRLALSLANTCGVHLENNTLKREYGNTLRGYFLPFKFDNMRWQAFSFDSSNKTEYVARTGHFIKDAISILRRKLIQTNGVFPIASANGVYASLCDIAAFINGSLNDDKIWALARPLMAISDWESIPHINTSPVKADIPAIYSVIRLAFPTEIKKDKIPVTADPTTLNQLLANNVRGAGQSAIRRLISSGSKPYIQTIVADRQLSQRVATSLLFPVNSYSLDLLESRLCKPTLENN